MVSGRLGKVGTGMDRILADVSSVLQESIKISTGQRVLLLVGERSTPGIWEFVLDAGR
jgi:hypothetical protein